MKIIRRRIDCLMRTVVGIGMVFCLTSPALAAGFVVIANKAVSESSLTKAELQAAYLGEKVKWENKKHIKLIVYTGQDAYKEFLQRVVGKTPAQFENHWQKMFFSGRAQLPQSFGEASQVTDAVARTPGALGFVPAGQAGDAVKTISIK